MHLEKGGSSVAQDCFVLMVVYSTVGTGTYIVARISRQLPSDSVCYVSYIVSKTRGCTSSMPSLASFPGKLSFAHKDRVEVKSLWPYPEHIQTQEDTTYIPIGGS